MELELPLWLFVIVVVALIVALAGLFGLFNWFLSLPFWLLGWNLLYLFAFMALAIYFVATQRGTIQYIAFTFLALLIFLTFIVPSVLLEFDGYAVFGLGLWVIPVIIVIDALIPSYPTAELLLMIPLKKFFGINFFYGWLISIGFFLFLAVIFSIMFFDIFAFIFRSIDLSIPMLVFYVVYFVVVIVAGNYILESD